MPLTTASGRSGGTFGSAATSSNSNQAPSRPTTTATATRVGTGSTVNQNRPSAPVRRATPSTSNLRPKLGSQSSSSSSVQQQVQTPSSLLASIPGPSFPPSTAFDHIVEDFTLVQRRLLQLARLYLRPNDSSDDPTSCDVHSASLYARLALQREPDSLPARRILALTLLHGAQPFPFGPSNHHSTSLSLTSNHTNLSSSSSISGAHAAIEVLKDGPQEVFLDVRCARIYAKACSILGKSQEGKEAMAWTLKQSEQGKTELEEDDDEDDEDDQVNHPSPPFLDSKRMEQAFIQTDLASLASKSNHYEEAKAGFIKAKKLDCWSWSAWVGLCDLGCNEDISTMFPMERYQPSVFYPAQLESRLVSHGIDKEIVSKMIEELKEKGDEYYTASEAVLSPNKEEEVTSQPLQRTGSAGATTSTTKRPVTSTTSVSTNSAAPPSFSRPGTKVEPGATATAGTKRVRTITAGSSQGGGTTTRAAGPNATNANGKGIAGNGNGTTDTHANKRPAVAGLKGRGAGVATQPTTSAINARATGTTLSAVRTNEQQRPASSASGSSRGANEKAIIKPRRSARVNVAVIDEPVPQVSSSSQKGGVVGRGATVAGGVAKRPAIRPTASDADTARKAAPVRSSVDTSTNKAMLNIMQTSAFEAARLAAVWNTADKEVKTILHTLGKAYYAVKNFQSKSALILLRSKRELTSAERAELRQEFGQDIPLKCFPGLKECHRNSADVQCLIARAYHNLSRYHLAESHFLHARRLSPSLDNHMDIFSLTLFHLQREVQISKLARDLSVLDANSCISHIAKGNAFALQREHSMALQSFQRACLAAPNCAYAFTLAGYEALELGFKDKSVKFFRQSLNIERRHWNAFAGLGLVYFESEKFTSAEYYYGQAIAIHRSNPVLWDVFGGVLSAQGKLQEAEAAFERAIALDSSLAMSHIKLAEVLLLQGETNAKKKEKAHDHLLEAVKFAPEEAHVHLMLAHTYMEKGNGSFARIDQGGKARAAAASGGSAQILLPSELQRLGATGLTGQGSTARAVGNSSIPNAYQAEIAKHLSAAIDLDPRYVRYVKAMGEGAKAALRGIVSRFLMDGNGMGDGSTLLMDSSAMTNEGQTMDSMVDLDGDQVLEDQGAMTEELESNDGVEEVEEEEEEGGDGDENEEIEEPEEEEEGEEGEEEEEGLEEEAEDDMENDSQSLEEMMEASMEEQVDVENGIEERNPRTLHRPSLEESDVSMSF